MKRKKAFSSVDTEASRLSLTLFFTLCLKHQHTHPNSHTRTRSHVSAHSHHQSARAQFFVKVAFPAALNRSQQKVKKQKITFTAIISFFIWRLFLFQWQQDFLPGKCQLLNATLIGRLMTNSLTLTGSFFCSKCSKKIKFVIYLMPFIHFWAWFPREEWKCGFSFFFSSEKASWKIPHKFPKLTS